jgi:hypothetical protein
MSSKEMVMKKLKLILAVCVVMFFPLASHAEDKAALALEYLELTKTKQLFDATIENYVNHLMAKNPNLNKDELTLFFSSYMSWSVLREPTVKIVSEKYTETELKGINAFFKTESGKALADKSPIISMEVSNLIGGNINKALSVIREKSQAGQQ